MILIITNDARMRYLADYLAGRFDVLAVNTVDGAPYKDELTKVEYFVMPFKLDDGIQEIVSMLPKSAMILTPIKHDILSGIAQKTEIIFDHDSIAIYNSIPTAEGVIHDIIENTDITIHSADILVIGGGRCAVTAARSLKALGANVRVSARNATQISRMYEMGIEYADIKKEEGLRTYDIIVNTVPAMVLNENMLQSVSKDCYIIDIASAPGGVDFETCAKLGIQAKLAPALPSKIAPKTAALYLFKFIKDYIVN